MINDVCGHSIVNFNLTSSSSTLPLFYYFTFLSMSLQYTP